MRFTGVLHPDTCTLGRAWYLGGSLGVPPLQGRGYAAKSCRGVDPRLPEDRMELGAARASGKDVELENVPCYEAHSEIDQKRCQTKEEQSVSSSSQQHRSPR